MVDYKFPKSFEATFTCENVSQDFIDWAMKKPDPKETLKQIEELMKKYNIPKENMVAERHTLKWLFLDSETNFGEQN